MAPLRTRRRAAAGQGRWALLAALAAAVCVPASGAPHLTMLGKFALKHASFAELCLNPRTQKLDLWLTAFAPFTPGAVFVVPDALNITDYSSVQPTQIEATGFSWPNRVTTAPAEAFPAGVAPVLVVPDGFLVPGAESGGLYLIPNADQAGAAKVAVVAAKKRGHFYHMVNWADINGDGRLDLLTARANGFLTDFKGELVWFEQPASRPFDSAWTEHVVAKGPDVFIDAHPDGPGRFIVYAAEFFTKALTVYELVNGTVTFSRTVDDSIGALEKVGLVSLAPDGVKQLVVNSHLGGAGGGLYAYTVPADIRQGTFERRVLATGFPVTEKGPGQAAPGLWYSVELSPAAPKSLLVAGDGSKEVYLLTPNSTRPGFSYNRTVIDQGGLVAAIAVGTSANKETRVFLPNYDDGTVTVLAFPSYS